jgi:hypothetical protein
MKLPFKLDMQTLLLIGIGAAVAYTFMKNQEVKANLGYYYGERRLYRDSGITDDPHPNIEWTTSRVTPA